MNEMNNEWNGELNYFISAASISFWFLDFINWWMRIEDIQSNSEINSEIRNEMAAEWSLKKPWIEVECR